MRYHQLRRPDLNIVTELSGDRKFSFNLYVVTRIKGNKNCLGKLCLIMLVLVLCSFQSTENWKVEGLESSYKLCEQVNFTLKRNVDSTIKFVVIGVQRRQEGKWVLLTEDITNSDAEKHIKIYGGMYYDKIDSAVDVSWLPCKLSYFSDKEFRPYFKGLFRFTFLIQTRHSKEQVQFFSEPFSIE